MNATQEARPVGRDDPGAPAADTKILFQNFGEYAHP